MENHLQLVREGKTITHHFGWQDYNDLSTKTTPVILTSINQWYELPNDGLGVNTNLDHKIVDHGNIWDTTNNHLDLTSLRLGDVVHLRLSAYITTHSSNVAVSGKLGMAIGSGIDYDIPFYSGLVKHSGRHLLSVSTMFYVGNEETRDYPSKIYALSDTSGVEIEVDGWFITSQCRS